MKTNKKVLVVSTLTLAVQGALVAMFAMPPLAFADDAEVAALTHPSNSIEIGIGNTSDSSASFGQYNGLNKSGTNLIGNFSVRGGDAYGAGNGINRWEFRGTDLGTTSRELSGSMSNQGQWSLGFGYDELQHNISDTYHTPFAGSMGGNTFILPNTYGVINTAYINSAFKIGTQALSPSQAAFLTQSATDVHTDRKNTSFTAGYNFDRQWGLKFDYNRLDQTGAKLISPGTDATKYGTFNSGFEKTIMLMNPTNYTTDTFNLAASWNGDKGHMTASYFGSFFRDGYNGLNFSNPFLQSGSGATATAPLNGTVYAGAFPLNMLSTAPSNDFHQLNLTGGYALSPTTKLAGGLSYGRNTQDDSYSSSGFMQAGGLPQTSLNALVVNTHADLKLTNQTSRNLVMSAGLKYNERDNRTASSIYKFLDLGGGAATSVNTPMSNSKAQMELAGDYRIDQNHRLHLGYEYEDVKRWCNNALANSTQGALATYISSSCVQIPESRESKIVAGYKLKAGEAVNFNAGYSYAKRNADVNPTFYNPMQAIAPDGYENFGYRAFFDASRTEQLVKAGVNWQANDKLSLGLNGRYVDDKFDDSPLGVQNGNAWSTNLDATYSYSENGVVSGYLSVQSRQRDMLSGGTRSTLTMATKLWTNQLKDENNTLGVALTQKGLMAGKLQLSGDLSYSVGKTGYSTQVPYSIATTAIPTLTCSDTQNLTCGSTPDIKTEVVTLKLTGIYQLDKASKVALGYMFQKQNSNDYYYNGYQNGYTPSGLLPTNEQAPNYSVNVVTVSYIYNF